MPIYYTMTKFQYKITTFFCFSKLKPFNLTYIRRNHD